MTKICPRRGFANPLVFIGLLAAGIVAFLIFRINLDRQALQKQNANLTTSLASIKSDLDKIKNTDQVKRNDELEKKIKTIETDYGKSVDFYQSILDLKASYPKADKNLDSLLAQAIHALASQDYNAAEGKFKELSDKIASEKTKYLATVTQTVDTSSAPENNSLPGSGYSRQSVKTDAGSFVIDIVAADLGSTKVIIDTASDDNCSDNCPSLSLGDYANRSGAFAGVNGTYFCPADYPSCAGKSNSFDLLVMNKNKKYINSDNNVYSSNPLAAFGSGWTRFLGSASGWGRDTSADGVISNFPLLVSGGNVAFGGNGDPKMGSAGLRQFVAAKDNQVFIGSIHGATVAEAALVLKSLGVSDALNLDSGGSSALWVQGKYVVGPGRNIPNAVLFVRR